MLTVNTSRLLQDLEELSQIGRTRDGGVSRPAMSPADLEARAWFRERIRSSGLKFHQDGAGNLSAILPAQAPDAPTLLSGSHLDTVPNGGQFDGALGVLAALEALRTIGETDVKLPINLEAVSFTDEEGAVLGLLGSQAIAGQLTPTVLDQPRGGRGALEAGMQRLGLTRESIFSARRDPAGLLAFVELHIEQGTRLEEEGVDIGVVSSIVGLRSHWLRFIGEAAHAGTMPMDRRSDAMWGTADFIRRAWRLVQGQFSPGVMNCGLLEVDPGAFNIVPAEVRLGLEFRHGTEDLLDEMEAALLEAAEESARASGLDLEVMPVDQSAPAAMDQGVMQAIETASQTLSLTHIRMMSYAGHDALPMSAATPTAMLFVPSENGISHSPRERTHPDDIVNGANALLHTLLELATGPGPSSSMT